MTNHIVKLFHLEKVELEKLTEHVKKFLFEILRVRIQNISVTILYRKTSTKESKVEK